jgi:hypothetical protein
MGGAIEHAMAREHARDEGDQRLMPAHHCERAGPQLVAVAAVPLHSTRPPFSINADTVAIIIAKHDDLRAPAGHQCRDRALAVIEAEERARIRLLDERGASSRFLIW